MLAVLLAVDTSVSAKPSSDGHPYSQLVCHIRRDLARAHSFRPTEFLTHTLSIKIRLLIQAAELHKITNAPGS